MVGEPEGLSVRAGEGNKRRLWGSDHLIVSIEKARRILCSEGFLGHKKDSDGAAQMQVLQSPVHRIVMTIVWSISQSHPTSLSLSFSLRLS